MRLLALAVVALGVASFASAARGAPAAGKATFIVVLKDSVPQAAPVAAAHAALVGGDVRYVYQHALKGYAVELPENLLGAIAADHRVAAIERDGVVTAFTTQTGATWGLDRIDQRSLPLSGTFTYTRTGSGVTAYIIDTGIRFSHSQFGGRGVSGTDTVD